MREAPRRRRALARHACLVVLVAAAVETMAWMAVERLGRVGVFYDPDLITQDYVAYASRRSASLGWAPEAGTNATNADGSRATGAGFAPGAACVSAFGDSFTWSTPMPDDRAWTALLSHALGCRVANFGVGGYGSDQALLRYREVPPQGGIAMLNHLSENIVRNVNQFRNLVYPGREFALKPRFVLEGSRLALVPPPLPPAARVADFLAAPEIALDHEYFLPDTAGGPLRATFPFVWSVLRAAVTDRHIGARLRGEPRHAAFYDPAHPAGGLAVTLAIFDAFGETASRNRQIGVVTIIPTCRDLRVLRATGRLPYAPLAEGASGRGYALLDFGPGLVARLGGADPATLYESCAGHFNARGYAHMAEIARAFLASDPRTAPYLRNVNAARAWTAAASARPTARTDR